MRGGIVVAMAEKLRSAPWTAEASAPFQDNESNHADRDRQQRAAYGGQTHGEQSVGEHGGHEVNAGNTHQQNGANVVQERNLRTAVRTEISAEAEMNAGKQAVPDITADVLSAGQNYGSVGGKQSHHRFGNALHDDADEQPKSCGDQDGVAKSQCGAIVLAGADVLGTQGRYGGQHGRRNQEQEADDLFHNADGGCVIQATLVGDDGDNNEGNLNEAVLKCHRKTDFQNLTHNGAFQFQVRAPQLYTRLLAKDHEQRDNHADRLRKGGAQCSAGGPHVHKADEQEVQDNIGNAGHGNKIHGAFGVAQSPEDGTDDIVCRDAGDADETDRQIGGCAGYGLCRSGHNGNDGPDKNQQDGHQYHGKCHKQGDGVADYGSGPFVFPGTDGTADADGGAHCKTDDHHGDHVHDLAAHGNRCGAGGTFKLADNEQVGHAVECL